MDTPDPTDVILEPSAAKAPGLWDRIMATLRGRS